MSANLHLAKPAMRTSLMGSSFFAKDSSSFFKDDTSGTDDSNALDDTSTTGPELDLVGALGALDLDSDLAPSTTDTSARDVSGVTTPFSQQTPFFSSGPSGLSRGGYGLLTPTGFGNSLTNPGNTPSSTWSNFVPFSAPPFAYSGDNGPATELAMRIAPFELPDDTDNVPLVVPGFGGALELRAAFPEPFALDYDKKDKSNVWNTYYRDARPTYKRGAANVHRKMHGRRKGDDAAKYANATAADFVGNMYLLCKDQHGCRFLQKQMDADPEVATLVFGEIYPKIVELMTDPFGNYLVQKLFEHALPDQRYVLVLTAAPEFLRISLDPHGTRALQKLVECVGTPAEARLVIESLTPHVVTLARDLNGNHVVQKCLQRLAAEDNQFIFDAVLAHCTEVATHRHGCCVLQRCLDHGSAAQRRQLSLKVAENATNLAMDPFGNYVVQYVLSRGDDQSISMIVEHIRAHVVQMSLHKFGSNVIEKSLRTPRLTDTVVAVLMANTDKFGVMLNDPFGNYVLQTALDVASPPDLAHLALALHPLLPNIKNTPHGRRIMTKIQNIG